jgi:uncharacterized protein YpmS
MSDENDKTNWKAWYWGLMIFLAIQIAIYYAITNYFQS